jgi:hypothetical protein
MKVLSPGLMRYRNARYATLLCQFGFGEGKREAAKFIMRRCEERSHWCTRGEVRMESGRELGVLLRWVGHAALIGDMRNAYKILARKSERKRPLGRHKRR